MANAKKWAQTAAGVAVVAANTIAGQPADEAKIRAEQTKARAEQQRRELEEESRRRQAERDRAAERRK